MGSNRLTRQNLDDLDRWIDGFLHDAQARDKSPRTVEFYGDELASFAGYCHSQAVNEVTAITADLVRDYLEYLRTVRKRNEGGRHAAFRAVRAFLLWFGREAEPPGWTSPHHKIRMGKPKLPPIPGVPAADVGAMVKTCGDDFIGYRDKALLLSLLDTGARAAEFIGLDLADIDPISGAVTIRKGKGSKTRTVFIGKKSRRAIRAYIRRRSDHDPALWVSIHGERLAVASLRQVLIRRAKRADVPIPSPHDFRRSFAVNMLRSGCDLVTLAKLMGHESLEVLLRYLALVDDDIQRAHEKGSPVDRLL